MQKLDRLYAQSPERPLLPSDKIAILSDFHAGNRSARDDFLRNSPTVLLMLRWYFQEGWTLILNGDIEELQKSRYERVRESWPDLFEIIDCFAKEGRLVKISGNHDHRLHQINPPDAANRNLLQSIILRHRAGTIFIFHGHQASRYGTAINILSGFFLRYLMQPFGIKNIVRAYENDAIHKTEKRVYDFSKNRGIVSIIGHTHRPLFEALSLIEILNFRIENLLRESISSSSSRRQVIENEILEYGRALLRMYQKQQARGSVRAVYDKELVIPAIFNSGCVIGKKMAHCIELADDTISLVRWYNETQKEKYFDADDDLPVLLREGLVFRNVLKKDSLEYIFTRMRLLHTL